MREQITLIFALHEQDLKAQKLQTALEALLPEVQELENLVANHRSQLDEKTAKIAELEAQKRSKEREVETAEIRLKDFQNKLSAIKTNKEYQAALKEIGDTKKLNKAMEDQILELMTQIEALKAEQKASEEGLSGSSANLEKKKAETESESSRLKSMLAEVEEEKRTTAFGIDADLMVQYQRVRRGRSEAVSAVLSGTCQRCRMKLPPQLFIEIQKMKSIHACPSCQRLLYLPEWVESKIEKKVDPRVDRPDGLPDN